MQCMVSYIKWYKEKENGKMENLIEKIELYLAGSLVVVKNGVLKTNPYLFEIQVRSLTIKTLKVLQPNISIFRTFPCQTVGRTGVLLGMFLVRPLCQ